MGSTRGQAGPLYNQPTNFFGGFYSEDDTSVPLRNYVTTYDDFTFGSTATIGSVSWVGGIINSVAVTPTAFTIDIFANSTT